MRSFGLNRGKKFEPPQPMMWREDEIPRMEPTENFKRERLLQTYGRNMRVLSQGKDPWLKGNQLPIGQGTAMQSAMMNAQAVELNALLNGDVNKKIDDAFIKDFQCWLQGKSKYNADKTLTPWGTKKLVGDSIMMYLNQFIDQKFAFSKFLAKLKLAPPDDIRMAWLYYKYIVCGMDPNGVDYLPEYNWLTDPEAIQREGQYPRQTVKSPGHVAYTVNNLTGEVVESVYGQGQPAVVERTDAQNAGVIGPKCDTWSEQLGPDPNAMPPPSAAQPTTNLVTLVNDNSTNVHEKANVVHNQDGSVVTPSSSSSSSNPYPLTKDITITLANGNEVTLPSHESLINEPREMEELRDIERNLRAIFTDYDESNAIYKAVVQTKFSGEEGMEGIVSYTNALKSAIDRATPRYQSIFTDQLLLDIIQNIENEIRDSPSAMTKEEHEHLTQQKRRLETYEAERERRSLSKKAEPSSKQPSAPSETASTAEKISSTSSESVSEKEAEEVFATPPTSPQPTPPVSPRMESSSSTSAAPTNENPQPLESAEFVEAKEKFEFFVNSEPAKKWATKAVRALDYINELPGTTDPLLTLSLEAAWLDLLTAEVFYNTAQKKWQFLEGQVPPVYSGVAPRPRLPTKIDLSDADLMHRGLNNNERDPRKSRKKK